VGDYGNPELQANRPLRELLEASVGTPRSVVDVSRRVGRQSITWRATSVSGEAFFLKRHQHRQHFLAELIALEQWIPALPPADWWTTPRLVGKSNELGALVMTVVAGEIFDESGLARSAGAGVYELAGRFAALLHRAKVDAESAGRPRSYDQETIVRLLDSARPYLDEPTVRWIEETVLQPNLWHGLRTVPVHADYSPRNWIVGYPALVLGVIDWERCRPGYWLEDVHRTMHDHWHRKPRYADAFFAGYGRRPSEAEERQSHLIALINAVGGLSWSFTYGDHDFARTNRVLMERCRRAILETEGSSRFVPDAPHTP
jgi:aminoglycoside phosphotransferase (APT) family kinase protein